MKFVILFFLLLSSPLFGKSKKIEVTIYGDESYPPYSYKNKGTKQLTGIYSDILVAASLKLKNYKISLVPVPWKRGIKYIQKGKGFAIFPPYHRVVDRPFMWPYSLPMANEEVIVVCKESVEKKKDMSWPMDFLGLTVGRNRGFSTGGPRWKELIKTKKIKDLEIGSLDQAIKMITKKRLDCYMNDKNSIFWTFKELRKKDEIKIKQPNFSQYATISRERGFIGYSAKSNPPHKNDFIKNMDRALHELRKSGEIQRIINNYIK